MHLDTRRGLAIHRRVIAILLDEIQFPTIPWETCSLNRCARWGSLSPCTYFHDPFARFSRGGGRGGGGKGGAGNVEMKMCPSRSRRRVNLATREAR